MWTLSDSPTHYSDGASNHPVLKGFSDAPLTCSLVHDPTLCPMLIHLYTSDHPVPLGLLQTGYANCTDAPWSVYPVPTGYSGDHAPVHPVQLCDFFSWRLNLVRVDPAPLVG